MVLLSEQERLYADELTLLNDASAYQITVESDWVTKKSVNISLPKAMLVCVSASFTAFASSGVTRGNGRITVDGFVAVATGAFNGSNTTVNTPDTYVYLASGSHTVNFDICAWKVGSGTTYFQVSNCFIGQLNFNDLASAGPWDSGSVALTAGSLTTLQNQNITIPAGRKVPAGQIVNYSLFLFAVVKDVSASPVRQVHFKNPGDSNDSSKINVQLFINSIQVAWTHQGNDDDTDTTDNVTYGRGGCGYLWNVQAAGQTLNITVKAYNSASGVSAECYLFAFLCPWITPAQDYSPVVLAFSQGSTFFGWLEPLYNNSTTFASKIGMKRFKSFGDSTDYYSVLSGTGVLQHSYVLDVVDVSSVVWVVSSTTIVCISYLAADVR